MSVSVKELLGSLPPYQDQWVMIHPNQTVPDIVDEVVRAHSEFAPYYDKIALYFDGGTVEDICKRLYQFCKREIKYHEEGEDDQTSALPTGILTRGYGDCKHYSGFCGGVLDALNRTGANIKWSYRFASYKMLDRSPHHVFIVVFDKGKEIWLDPTPKANTLTPYWQIDKKVKSSTMALRRNISGFEEAQTPEDIINAALMEDEGDENIPENITEAIRLLLYFGILNEAGEFNESMLHSLASQLPQSDYEQVFNSYLLLTDPKTVGSFIGDIWNGIKKVTLALPRNAFLSLVGLNVFNYATKLKRALTNAEGRAKLQKAWEKLGGSFRALENTVNDGAKKKAILGAAPAAVPAWVATAAACIAAIMPLVKLILDKIGPGAGGGDGDPGANPYPYGICEDGITPRNADGTCPGSQGTDIMGWIQAHPLESAAIGLGGYFLLFKKKKVSGLPTYAVPVGIALAAFLMFRKKAAAPAGQDDEHKAFNELSSTLEADPVFVEGVFPIDFYDAIETQIADYKAGAPGTYNDAAVYKGRGTPGAFMAVADAWQKSIGFSEETHKKLWQIFAAYVAKLDSREIIGVAQGQHPCTSDATWIRSCVTNRDGSITVTATNRATGLGGSYTILTNSNSN